MIDNKGIYDKFHVSRTDGDPTGKHANCGYFVLDPAHDPAAFAALECYIAAAWDERPELVGDISTWLETIQQEADHA